MPEWHRPQEWADMGLWEGHQNRAPHTPALEALAEARHLNRYALPRINANGFPRLQNRQSDKDAFALDETKHNEAELEALQVEC
jgi:hypothetical protein